MPPLDWQLIAVLACIAGAAFVVARRIWRLVRPVSSGQAAGGCGSCGTCGVGSTTTVSKTNGAFIPLDSLANTLSADKR